MTTEAAQASRRCVTCKFSSPPPWRGVMQCMVDGRDALDHAGRLYCPHPEGARFGSGIEPGDWASVPQVNLTISGKTIPRPAEPLSPDARRLIDAEVAGLGDDVEAIAKAIGADRLAKVLEELTGWDCGCEERKRLLNKLPGFAKAWGWMLNRFGRLFE